MNRLWVVGCSLIVLASYVTADTAVKVGYSFSLLRSSDVGPAASAWCASDGVLNRVESC